MKAQIVILGLGGQGILYVTKVLAEAAICEGWRVITTETHGMAQRGGAVESHLKFGDFESPLVRRGKADATLAIDASRVEAARAYGGVCFHRDDAREFGRSANLVVLGTAVRKAPEFFPSREAVLKVLDREDNRRAFLKGCE